MLAVVAICDRNIFHCCVREQRIRRGHIDEEISAATLASRLHFCVDVPERLTPVY